MKNVAKISPTMSRALGKLTDKWQSAYSLGESRGTLNALTARNLAECSYPLGSMAFPATTQYRLKRKPDVSS